MRANAITVIHKYIRRELFDLSERLFRAESHDLNALRTAFEDVRTLLRGHGDQEDARLAPMLRECAPEIAEQMRLDHDRLDQQLEDVYRMVKALNASDPDCMHALSALHLNWNRFVGAYLLHLDAEERTYFVPIADRLPPVAALAQMANSHPHGQSLLLRLWAVTTCEERAAIEGVARLERAEAKEAQARAAAIT